MTPRALAMIEGVPFAVNADLHQFELRTPTERIETGPPIAHMYGPFRFVANRYLVCFIGGGIAEYSFRVYDVLAREWAGELLELGNEVHCAGVHPTEPRIALVYDDAVHFWNVAGRSHESVIDESYMPGYCNRVAFHPRDPVLAVGGYQQLSIVSLTGELERVIPEAHHGDVDAVEWATDELLVTSGITNLKIWNRDLTLRHAIDLKGARSTDVIASAQAVCAMCTDGSARVIDLATLAIRVEKDVGAAVFDGAALVVAGDAGIRTLAI